MPMKPPAFAGALLAFLLPIIPSSHPLAGQALSGDAGPDQPRISATLTRADTHLVLSLAVEREGEPLSASMALADGQSYALILRSGEDGNTGLVVRAVRQGDAVYLDTWPGPSGTAEEARRQVVRPPSAAAASLASAREGLTPRPRWTALSSLATATD